MKRNETVKYTRDEESPVEKTLAEERDLDYILYNSNVKTLALAAEDSRRTGFHRGEKENYRRNLRAIQNERRTLLAVQERLEASLVELNMIENIHNTKRSRIEEGILKALDSIQE